MFTYIFNCSYNFKATEQYGTWLGNQSKGLEYQWFKSPGHWSLPLGW